VSAAERVSATLPQEEMMHIKHLTSATVQREVDKFSEGNDAPCIQCGGDADATAVLAVTAADVGVFDLPPDCNPVIMFRVCMDCIHDHEEEVMALAAARLIASSDEFSKIGQSN